MKVIGVEIGGTKLQVALADAESLKPICSLREEIVPANGAAGIRAQLEALIRSLLAEHSAEAIGIGFGGPLDAKTGIITTSHQVEGWDQFPLAHWCRDRFELPTTIRNDCDTAALAEASLGAGKGRQSSFYVTVGSGIGGGYVVDGQLQGGSRPAFAEIGHLRPGVGYKEADETVEAESSGFGIAQRLKDWLKNLDEEDQDDEYQSLLDRCDGDFTQLTTRDIVEAAQAGSNMCRTVLADGVETLGWGIAQVITLLAPEVVVIGGGVAMMPEEFFLTPLKQQVAAFVFPPLAKSYEIVPAALGEAVVVQGALLLARQLLEK
ncbi:ROK family protein [Blastopirellula marina]|uniref:ROK family protein n=1 Tax=Blastopirellula marina TaxID=124 RepID=A0A2S8F7X1_9BACT|nr:ROK family protein [Blastopirellula marina]PQO28253.1 ROK family protein [Blastopirellula marina]PTL41793.1 ROK family protein [Blastopirellula marina]